MKFLESLSKTSIANILGVIIVLGCFLIVYMLIIHEVPSNNKDLVNTAVGFVLGGLLGGVTGYFFCASYMKKDNQTNP